MELDFSDINFNDLGFVDKKAGKRIMKYTNSKRLEDENLEFDDMVDRYNKDKEPSKTNKDTIKYIKITKAKKILKI